MGLLDQVIGGVVGQVLGGGRGGALASPVVKALLMLLLAKGAGGLGGGAGGGLGDIFGRGSPDSGGRPFPDPGADDGDLGGFNQGRRSGPPAQGDDPGGDFGDLAGMLDGPGDGHSGHRSPGEGPYAGLDREPQDGSGPAAGGLDGLIQSFERSGLGDVIGSWIGHGPNREIAPNRLAEALGPGTVDSLSRETGLPREDLLAQLAQALPGVIDALTPQGRAPSREERGGW